MSGRDSDSKRRHSKYDREPSPKRHRRDGNGKQERDKRNHSNQQAAPVNKDAADNKSNPNDHLSDPTQPPRSRSYYQHDERGSTGQAGRSADRREAGGKVYTQNRERNERVETRQSRELRDEKSQAKLDDNFHRRDGFPERKDDPPPPIRKRPAFREKKIPVDSGDANPAAAVTVKSTHADHPPERNEKKEERSANPRHLDRPEKQIALDRANKSEARRDGFSSRMRYGSVGGNSNYRGRDKFNGRQGYQPSKTRAEKWKHDLYQEINKDPIPKSEDDQVAKLEALLAS